MDLSIFNRIVQAPMFGVGTPAMAAGASNAGVLGSLPLADLPAKDCVQLIRQTRALTNKAFAVNIFLNEVPPVDEALIRQYHATKRLLEELAAAEGFEVALPAIADMRITDYHEQVEALIAEQCKIVSFTFGNLDADSIARFKQHGTLLVGTCTSLSEAKVLEDTGIDIVCLQGIEAGGHRGSFESAGTEQVDGLSLLLQLKEQLRVPVIYAGGITDAQAIRHVLSKGADGVQIGSMFLTAKESALQDFEKARLHAIKGAETLLISSFSGRYARGLNNTYVQLVEQSGHVLPYPYMNKITGPFRKAARAHGKAELVNLWVGQHHRSFSDAGTEQIVRQLLVDLEQFK